jgi:hypothetical protein
MDSFWPWLAVAGAGALHGLNPLAGWGPAAALAVRDGSDDRDGRDGRQRRWLSALASIAAGHLVSVGLTAIVIAQGLDDGRWWLTGVAMAGFAAMAARHVRRRSTAPLRAMAAGTAMGGWGLGLWSFIAATAHGAGTMLLPALAPLCLGTAVGRDLTASGSLTLALLVVTVHAAAMVATAGMAALLATRGWRALRRPWR